MENPIRQIEEKFIQKSESINVMVNYFGKENRTLVEERINNTKLIYFPQDIAKYEIVQQFKEKYKNESNETYKKQADIFITNLENLANRVDLVEPLILLKYKDILKNLSFDVDKIVVKNKETGLYEIIFSEETAKLISYIKFNTINSDRFNIFCDVDNIIKTYKLLKGNIPNENNSCICFNKNGEIGLNLRCEFENFYSKFYCDIKQPLSQKEKEFIDDIFSIKHITPFMKNEKYIISNINNLFNKNYKTLDDLFKDDSMQSFLELRNYFSEIRSNLIKYANTNHVFREYYGDEEYSFLEVYFAQRLTLAGVHVLDLNRKNFIGIPLGENTNSNTVIHEFNHAIAGKSSLESYAFDEIVNEYLTIRQIENMSKDIKQKCNFEKENKNAYTTSVKFFKKFLDKYEYVFKRSRLNDNIREDLIKEFDNNKILAEYKYDTIINICNTLEMYNFGNIQYLDNNNEIKEININEFIESYYKNPNYVVELLKNIYNEDVLMFLGYIVWCNEFLDRVISKENVSNLGTIKPLNELVEEKYNTNQFNL